MKTILTLYAIVGTIYFFLYMGDVGPVVAHTNGLPFVLMMLAPVALGALVLAPALELITEMLKDSDKKDDSVG